MEILKVSSRSTPNSVAGAISNLMKRDGQVEIQSIGAGATNQAVKSIAIARGYLITAGLDLVCVPSFTEITVNDEDRTAIRFICTIN